jgi:hypothetical protein
MPFKPLAPNPLTKLPSFLELPEQGMFHIWLSSP